MGAREKYKEIGNTEFILLDISNPTANLPSIEDAYGLIIVRLPRESSISVTTLDVECSSGSQTFKVIDSVLHTLQQPALKRHIKDGYVERGGVISLCSILPNHPINIAETEKTHGAQLHVRDIHKAETTI